MIKKTMLAGLALVLNTGAVLADENWTAGGFDMPESAVFDTERNRIILSTIIGNPGAADGQGSLVLLSPEGDVIDANWAVGLDAPKGMAILGDVLLVADLTRLHEIDLATGKIRRSLAMPEAVFLNDVTSDGEVAFVSDLMTDSLWRYADGALTLWFSDPQLAHPNGVFLDEGRLLVGSWGAGLRDDFTTETQGSLLSVSLDTKEISVVAPNIGNIDGITRIDDAIIVSDWVTGGLLEIGRDGVAQQVAQFAPGLADISSDGSTLYLPMMLDGSLISRDYP
ncbi:Sugar lactone lactonase YvrE [Pseudosulfitobacter pseudonitzschiae]|uniref:ATP/GTP-binding protein n=1 Tax=Pseudosulfitobacter pseudonitzschiae TaxID=1402135 RepID=A0A073JA24_9RHOB|nr:hypothetical protein [Pseudosulfitobacter pseudonitzschiae]KEJ94547.1 hypothetical protein SUH3_05835 [Pseudosulfitobacter pseudonitzschiae]QKS08470.1 ATP/GTP-binding protein [Pseudosulfitobacter pseudonitzschiae]SHF75279.1 Sugar lactone lactonase YvrE [Pseudosulfitobacter pseudonitzschiae]